jgi:hypothetical protein
VWTATEGEDVPPLLHPELAGQLARDLDLLNGEYRSPGERFASEWQANYLRAKTPLHPDEVRTLITTSTSDTPKGGVLLAHGDVDTGLPARRSLFVRDLLTTGRSVERLVPYVRQVNTAATETGPSAVPEGGAKPEATWTFDGAENSAKKVSTWVPATSEITQDAPALVTFVDNQLLYLLRVTEDRELLRGDGAGGRPLGLLNDTGVPTVTAGANTRASITKGLRSVEGAGGQADAVILHPEDAWGIFDGDPHFFERLRELGVVTLRTPAMLVGRALVGAFRVAVTLLDHKRGEVRVSESHDDYFVKNKVGILAEEQVILNVHIPSFLADVTL